ncbi:2-dehydropantoate 2-reductase [Sporosarcina sp. BI001-red]|uniref:2-dehydropantoate 2-reductase n=1 Tax=Sporosarcina sp. BI001-red TaxID=2282866 RepID=UPI000E26E1DA|nr:2-dehydropantoate 2-reductase [Sporosarcina sp. BI001-red]REB09665.1 2-dehydropantoate 2-reductase [Sporosarcina sp. BI001-red]
MEVVIAGAGAMGLLIGSYLAESGISVSFLTRREGQAIALRDHGVTRVQNDLESTFRVHAFSDLLLAPKNALWILAVKSKDLSDLVKQLEKSKSLGHLMFIQNGLRHYDLGRSTSIPSVSVASLTHGAGKIDDRTVSHNGVGMMSIAELKGSQRYSSQLSKANSPSFPILYQQDALQMLLKKALINCCINPLTTILELKNGDLLTNGPAHQLMEVIYDELATGYPEVLKTLPFSEVEVVCRKTADNRSSMLTDRYNGVPMEIDTIISAIVEGYEETMPTLKAFETLLKAIDEREDDA